MSFMTETAQPDNTLILAGRVVAFIPPTQGQIEAMIRIARSTERADDGQGNEFWIKQISRIGDLLEALIAEGDRETVEDLYIAGKLNHAELLGAILTKIEANGAKSEDKAIAKAKKAGSARVQRK